MAMKRSIPVGDDTTFPDFVARKYPPIKRAPARVEAVVCKRGPIKWVSCAAPEKGAGK